LYRFKLEFGEGPDNRDWEKPDHGVNDALLFNAAFPKKDSPMIRKMIMITSHPCQMIALWRAGGSIIKG